MGRLPVLRFDDEVIERLGDLFVERNLQSKGLTFYQFIEQVQKNGDIEMLMFDGKVRWV